MIEDLKFDNIDEYGNTYAKVHFKNGEDRIVCKLKSVIGSYVYAYGSMENGHLFYGEVIGTNEKSANWRLETDQNKPPFNYVLNAFTQGQNNTVEDKDGNLMTFYHDGSQKVEYKEGKILYYDKEGTEYHLGRRDHRTVVDYAKDKDGNEIYYSKTGKTFGGEKRLTDEYIPYYPIDYKRDKDGNEVHYLSDGKTIDYKLSADGVRTDRDGIKDNILAKKRRYYAKKMGLEKKKTSKLFRQVEAFVAKGMSSGK